MEHLNREPASLCENLGCVTQCSGVKPYPVIECKSKCRTGARSSVWKRQDELSHRFFDCGTLTGRHPNAGKPVVSKRLEDWPILG